MHAGCPQVVSVAGEHSCRRVARGQYPRGARGRPTIDCNCRQICVPAGMSACNKTAGVPAGYTRGLPASDISCRRTLMPADSPRAILAGSPQATAISDKFTCLRASSRAIKPQVHPRALPAGTPAGARSCKHTCTPAGVPAVFTCRPRLNSWFLKSKTRLQAARGCGVFT